LFPLLRTSGTSYRDRTDDDGETTMAVAHEITLKGERTVRVDGADAYVQEGQLTTFFRTDPQRGTVDRWSVRLASFRTSEVMAVRRLEPEPVAEGPSSVEAAWIDGERGPRLRTVG
jgi:hypothetical protein